VTLFAIRVMSFTAHVEVIVAAKSLNPHGLLVLIEEGALLARWEPQIRQLFRALIAIAP
jgi:hypothetical protein